MISSPANPRVKAVAELRNRRQRDRTGRFPVEGVRPVQRALAAGWPLDEMFLAPELLGTVADELEAAAAHAGISVTEVAPRALAKMTYRADPEGVLAVARHWTHVLEDLPVSRNGLYLVTEAVEKPGNIGAMLRTAEAAGVTAVIAADAATDLTNPNVVRASQGALFAVPCAAAAASAVRHWLAERDLHALAARPDGGADLWQTDLTGGIAVVVGSEHAGLSPVWDGAAAVTIPMLGHRDSLNAATSAAIILFEAVRQRTAAG